MKNKYLVYNTVGQQIYFVQEGMYIQVLSCLQNTLKEEMKGEWQQIADFIFYHNMLINVKYYCIIKWKLKQCGVLFLETDFCTRFCWGPLRPFDIQVVDNYQREVMRLVRPLRCQGCCCPCCLQEMEIHAPPGQVIGYVKERYG